MAINPFIWDRPLDDPAKIVGMDDFARKVALVLKGQTNVALFGPRATGKSTLLTKLRIELEQRHGPDAPPFAVVRIDLQRAISVPAFISCVHTAMIHHPVDKIRRAGQRELRTLEKEIGFDIKVIKGGLRSKGRTPEDDAHALHELLASLARLGEHVVVIFDEFQRLSRCPDRPLAVIRAALMGPEANHVSLMLTGSIREQLEMMLRDDKEPIWDQAQEIGLPVIDKHEFLGFLELNFAATNKPIEPPATEHLVDLTESHPKRTQQLAWHVWDRVDEDRGVRVEAVQDAYQELIGSARLNSDFTKIVEPLQDGDESEQNEYKALLLVADRGGENITSRESARLYGLGSHTTPERALERLRERGLVVRSNGDWRILDPFLTAWLKQISPFADA